MCMRTGCSAGRGQGHPRQAATHPCDPDHCPHWSWRQQPHGGLPGCPWPPTAAIRYGRRSTFHPTCIGKQRAGMRERNGAPTSSLFLSPVHAGAASCVPPHSRLQVLVAVAGQLVSEPAVQQVAWRGRLQHQVGGAWACRRRRRQRRRDPRLGGASPLGADRRRHGLFFLRRHALAAREAGVLAPS